MANAYSESARNYRVLIPEIPCCRSHTNGVCQHALKPSLLSSTQETMSLYSRLQESGLQLNMWKGWSTMSSWNWIDLTFLASEQTKKARDPTVHNLRLLQFGQWRQGPFHIVNSQKPLCGNNCHKWYSYQIGQWHGLFPCALPIKERKFQDLWSMKPIMPVKCHHSFDNLPH